jgi:tetratricopeptide (TPR) repeat protein
VPVIDEAPAAAPVPIETRRPNRAPALAAAAMLTVAVLGGGWWYWQQQNPLKPLQGAVAASSVRPIVARAGGFEHATKPTAFRSADGGTPQKQVGPEIEAAALDVFLRHGDSSNPRRLHAAGISLLVIGDHSHRDDAVAKLTQATERDPGNAHYWNDLAAAYITLGSAGDLVKAEAAVKRALQIDPNLLDAKFNQALITERLNRPREAAALWQQYIAAETDPGWRDEATQNLERVQELLQP